MLNKVREFFFDILIANEPQRKFAKYFNFGMLFLITLNVFAVVMETTESFYLANKKLFDNFEVFSVTVFTIEYLLRLWVCTKLPDFSSPVTGRIRYMLRPLQLVDLFAILPFYIPTARLDLRFIRAIRLFRVFRLFKTGRYTQSLNTIIRVFRQKKEELGITIFSGIILLLLSSSIMYLVENAAQPDKFKSIPDAMWWGVATLTTVGYGDIFPITTVGKIFGSITAMLGIGLFALPAGIVASGFAAEIARKKDEPKTCPHCGKVIDEN